MTTEPTITDRFEALKGALPGAELDWLAGIRARALEGFVAGGLPTLKVEAWKYTNLAPLAKLSFMPAAPVKNGLTASSLPWLLPATAKAHRLVFVNGRLREDLSALGKLPEGVLLAGLAAVLKKEPALLEDRLGALIAIERQPMVALNTAFMADGFVLSLGRGVMLEHPIELLFIAMPEGDPRGPRALRPGEVPGGSAVYPRGLVLGGVGSRATIVEQHIGIGQGSYFANPVTEIVLEEKATLRHYKRQAEGAEAFHIATHQISVGKGGSYESFVLADGGRLARTEIGLVLDGEGAACRLDGAYMGRGRQHIDNTTAIDHAYPHTTSRETYKGVLDDRARGVFQGRILVRKGAEKADGQQTCRTLLLSEGAEIDAKPELRIYADDVKCSHGAAAGELDEDWLFYLRSRGIPEPEARHMLVEAFLGETIDEIANEEARNGFRRVVAGWIAPKSMERRG